MSTSKLLLKTFPDRIDLHKDLPVDGFEVAIRPVVFGKKTSLQSQLDAYAPIANKVIGIHGSIYREGVNFLDPDARATNLEALSYCKDALNTFSSAEYVLFHPGHMIANSSCSFDSFFDFVQTHKFPLLNFEFEPFFSYDARLVFPLHTVEEWLQFKKTHGQNMILDTAHCFITANALGYDYYAYFKHLCEALSPTVIHLSTTDMSDGGINDRHLPFSLGAIDFNKLKPCFEGKTLVIEVNNVTESDIDFIHNLMSNA